MSDKVPIFIERPTPPKGERKCDFCSSFDPQWSYPCRDFSHTEHVDAILMKKDFSSLRNESMSIEANSMGAWAACPACHALIQRGDRARLARRSAKRLLRNIDPGMAAAWPLRNAIEHCRRIHDKFWQNREGKPTRITETREDQT